MKSSRNNNGPNIRPLRTTHAHYTTPTHYTIYLLLYWIDNPADKTQEKKTLKYINQVKLAKCSIEILFYNTLHYTHTLHTLNAHYKKRAKSLAAAKWPCQPSEPALGFLSTTQDTKSKSTWGRASTPQMELCHAPG